MLESFQRKDELHLFNRMSHFCETEEEEKVARNVSVELIATNSWRKLLLNQYRYGIFNKF